MVRTEPIWPSGPATVQVVLNHGPIWQNPLIFGQALSAGALITASSGTVTKSAARAAAAESVRAASAAAAIFKCMSVSPNWLLMMAKLAMRRRGSQPTFEPGAARLAGERVQL